MIERLVNSKVKMPFMIINNIAWNCILIPNAVENLNEIVALAEEAVAADRTYPNMNTLGAALYRAGREEEAFQRLKESAALSEDKLGNPYDWPFEAMALHRLSRRFEAWILVKKSDLWVAMMEKKVAREKTTDESEIVTHRLHIGLLSEETKALLNRK